MLKYFHVLDWLFANLEWRLGYFFSIFAALFTQWGVQD
jgi:hypothetical protein